MSSQRKYSCNQYSDKTSTSNTQDRTSIRPRTWFKSHNITFCILCGSLSTTQPVNQHPTQSVTLQGVVKCWLWSVPSVITFVVFQSRLGYTHTHTHTVQKVIKSQELVFGLARSRFFPIFFIILFLFTTSFDCDAALYHR